MNYKSPRPNVIREKSYSFAIKIVLFCQKLPSQYNFTLSNQLLRSGTSIGANIEEAGGAYSKKEFRAKLGIAYKEARETKYWLRLLKDTDISPASEIDPLISDVGEIIKILVSILKSSQEQP